MYLVDYKIDYRFENYLKNNKIDYLKTFKYERLYEEINGHPDIIACHIGNTTIIEPIIYDKIKDILYGYDIIKGKTKLSSNYPNNIAYNVVITNNSLIGKLDNIDENILKIAKQKNLELINVNQGYARCSTVTINEIIITSDISIYNILKQKDEKVYYIPIRDIFLSERYYGFIGGASAVIDNKLIFFGNIEKSICFKEIKEILDRHKIEYDIAFDDRLCDYGSMITLNKK